jgi:glutaredoxin 3
MNNKRKIEVFSAGCSCCTDAVELVNRIAGDSGNVQVLDMHQEDVAAKAKEYGVQSVPAIAVDGKLADCCTGRGIEEATLKASGIGV